MPYNLNKHDSELSELGIEMDRATPPVIPPRTYLTHLVPPAKTNAVAFDANKAIAKAPYSFDVPAREQAAKHIIENEGYSQDEYTFAAKYILGHPVFSMDYIVKANRYIFNHSDVVTPVEYAYTTMQIVKFSDNYYKEELVKAIKFIVQFPQYSTVTDFIFTAKKMIEFHDQYCDLVTKRILTSNDPHFSDEDLLAATQAFVLNTDFFTKPIDKQSEVRAFYESRQKSSVMDDYSTQLHKVLISACHKHKEPLMPSVLVDLWFQKKFNEALAMDINIALFILRNLAHEAITLWIPGLEQQVNQIK
jgi:hypothetical protein